MKKRKGVHTVQAEKKRDFFYAKLPQHEFALFELFDGG
jgi:hypothetical protein